MFPLFLDIWDFHLREDGEFFILFFLHQSVVCWCETGQEIDSVLSEALHLLEQNSLLCICSLMKISLLANLQSNHNHSQVQYVLY